MSFWGAPLATYGASRDNNFNLLRFVAATLVLVSHSYALCTGSAAAEPFRQSLGISLGGLAVDIFFAASGFLVTGSLLARRRLADFVASRFLRIYPGLWLALLLTIVFVCWQVTELSAREFLVEPQTWKHLFKNAVMLSGVDYRLPGAFLHDPWPEAVNGSLWTLPYELRMYLLLAGLWLVAQCLRVDTTRWVSRVCVLLGALGLALGAYFTITGTESKLILLGGMFFSGAALRVLQDRVPLSGRLALMLAVALFVAAFWGPRAFGLVYRLALPYLVLWCAYVPDGLIRRFNVFGDYSYGIYIYAFPIQQALIGYWRGISPNELTVMAFGCVLPLAVLSWHFVEKRALALKRRFGVKLNA